MKKLIMSIMLSAILILLLLPITVSAETVNKPITPKDIKEMTFVHFAKPDTPPGQDKKDKPEPEPEGEYVLIGTKLLNNVEYFINISSVPDGLSTESAADEIDAAFGTWENEIGNTDLFTYADTTTASGRRYDGQNTISWARIAPKSTIAIATFWYTSDPSGYYKVLEFDIVFNSFLNWGIDPDDFGSEVLDNAFDIQNIATHEAGHIVGLGDLYDNENNEQTMYGYSSIGEIIKIDLASGDIAGVHAIY